MIGEPREVFFARIQQALSDRGRPVDLPGDLEIARVVTPDRDLAGEFIQRVDQSGMKAHRVADESAASRKVVELLTDMGASRVVIPPAEMPARAAIEAAIRDKGLEFCDPDNPDAAFSADVGITGVVTAIAETGSISVISGDGHRRLSSLAPPNHIALMRADQIVPDLLDWTGSRPEQVPANEVLITGPSKTADIEMTLVAGVHGPGRVDIVIIG